MRAACGSVCPCPRAQGASAPPAGCHGVKSALGTGAQARHPRSPGSSPRALSTPPATTEDSRLPPGLLYLPRFLTPAEQSSLLEDIDSRPYSRWIHRRQQFYGAVYYHTPQCPRSTLQPLAEGASVAATGDDGSRPPSPTIASITAAPSVAPTGPSPASALPLAPLDWVVDRARERGAFDWATEDDVMAEHAVYTPNSPPCTCGGGEGAPRLVRVPRYGPPLPSSTAPPESPAVAENSAGAENSAVASCGSHADIEDLSRHLPSSDALPFPTQILVNEYTGRQNIGAHFDDALAFGPHVLGLSLHYQAGGHPTSSSVSPPTDEDEEGAAGALILTLPHCLGAETARRRIAAGLAPGFPLGTLRGPLQPSFSPGHEQGQREAQQDEASAESEKCGKDGENGGKEGEYSRRARRLRVQKELQRQKREAQRVRDSLAAAVAARLAADAGSDEAAEAAAMAAEREAVCAASEAVGLSVDLALELAWVAGLRDWGVPSEAALTPDELYLDDFFGPEELDRIDAAAEPAPGPGDLARVPGCSLREFSKLGRALAGGDAEVDRVEGRVRPSASSTGPTGSSCGSVSGTAIVGGRGDEAGEWGARVFGHHAPAVAASLANPSDSPTDNPSGTPADHPAGNNEPPDLGDPALWAEAPGPLALARFCRCSRDGRRRAAAQEVGVARARLRDRLAAAGKSKGGADVDGSKKKKKKTGDDGVDQEAAVAAAVAAAIRPNGADSDGYAHGDIFLPLRSALLSLADTPLAPTLADVNQCCYSAHTATVPLGRGSVYVMTGDARYLYRHGTRKPGRAAAAASHDDGDRRVSLTLRSLLPGRRVVVAGSEEDCAQREHKYTATASVSVKEKHG